MDKDNRSVKYGFSLIEILIAVAIIAVLSGLSFASYRQFNEKKILDEATRQFIEALELAKKKAVVTEKPAAGCLNPAFPFDGQYMVDWGNPNPSTYRILTCCSGTTCALVTATFNAHPNIRFVSAGTKIIFKPFGLTTSTPFTTITIRNINSPWTRLVIITPDAAIDF